MNQKGLTYAELLISLFVASLGTIGIVPLFLLGFQPFFLLGGIDLNKVNEIALEKLEKLSHSSPYQIENIMNRISTENYNGFTVETTATRSKIYPNLVKIIVRINWKHWSGKEEHSAVYAVYYSKFQAQF